MAEFFFTENSLEHAELKSVNILAISLTVPEICAK